MLLSKWGGVTPTLINFTIEDALSSSFQAKEGMTWNQWVASSYNPGGYFITYQVSVPGGYEWHVKPNNQSGEDVYIKNGRAVIADQTIIPNGEYKLGGVLSETWLMNDSISPQADTDLHFDVSFTSNGNQYTEFAIKYTGNGTIIIVFFDNFITPVYMVNPYIQQRWVNQTYRTITLDSPATDDFLAWLEANAVKQ